MDTQDKSNFEFLALLDHGSGKGRRQILLRAPAAAAAQTHQHKSSSAAMAVSTRHLSVIWTLRKQCVIVEWIENGETKGKSIDFPDVFEFNPTLGPQAAGGSSGNRNLHLDLGSATNGSELSDHKRGRWRRVGGIVGER